MKSFVERLPKTFSSALSALFVGVGIVEYLAYYEGLVALFQDFTGRLPIVIAIVVTYMFRLDIIAGSIGFWGAWAIWHWPLWVVMILTTAFLTLSLLVNYGPGNNPKTFLQKLWTPKRAKPSTANEE